MTGLSRASSAGAFSLLGVMRVGSWTSSKRLSRYLIGSLVSFICVHSVDWASFRPAPRPRASTPSPADNLSNPEKRHWTNVGRLGRPRRLTWRSCPYWREKILVLGSSRLFGLGRNTTFSRRGGNVVRASARQDRGNCKRSTSAAPASSSHCRSPSQSAPARRRVAPFLGAWRDLLGFRRVSLCESTFAEKIRHGNQQYRQRLGLGRTGNRH